MVLTKLEEDLNIVENLPDSPNLEPDELKRKFDESSIKIKNFINETLTTEIDTIVTQIKKDMNNKILEDNKKKYYVGKLIFDTENVNPVIYLGFGTWELWGQGRVPVGIDPDDEDFNTVEKTGGEKTHVLTVEEMPKHRHSINTANGQGNMEWGYAFSYDNRSAYNGMMEWQGGNQPHNNMQPYITCYIWKRTA